MTSDFKDRTVALAEMRARLEASRAALTESLMPSTPISSELAAGYGYDIPAGWKISLSQDGGVKPTATLIDPAGWQYSDLAWGETGDIADFLATSPQGKTYTKAELELQQAVEQTRYTTEQATYGASQAEWEKALIALSPFETTKGLYDIGAIRAAIEAGEVEISEGQFTSLFGALAGWPTVTAPQVGLPTQAQQNEAMAALSKLDIETTEGMFDVEAARAGLSAEHFRWLFGAVPIDVQVELPERMQRETIAETVTVPTPELGEPLVGAELDKYLEDLFARGLTPNAFNTLKDMGLATEEIENLFDYIRQPASVRQIPTLFFKALPDFGEPEDFDAIWDYVREHPGILRNAIITKGRNPDTEALVRAIYGPDITERGVDDYFETKGVSEVVEPTELIATQLTGEQRVEQLIGRQLTFGEVLGASPIPELGGRTYNMALINELAGVSPEPVPDTDPLGALKVFGQGLLKLPRQLAASILQAFQGQGGASVVDKDWADRFIEDAQADLDKFVAEVGEKYGEKAVLETAPFLKITDVAALPQNLAYSLTTMGAGLGVGIPIALIPWPGMRVTAYVTGTATSGAVAYSMTTYQIMQLYLELKNEEKIAEIGEGITLQEENQLKREFESKAREYGLWEAIPEAISNLAFVSILTAPLTAVAGKAIATKVLAKLVGMYGEELLTETITQKGQSAIEVEVGLREGNISWMEAFKEVAPQTFLLTTILGGTGQAGVSAVNRIKASLKVEIGESHPLYKTLDEGITEEIIPSVEAPAAPVTEIKPPVTPTEVPTVAPGLTAEEIAEREARPAVSEFERRLTGELEVELAVPEVAPTPEVAKPPSQYGLSQTARQADIQGIRQEGTLARYNLQAQQEWLGKGTRYAVPVPEGGRLTIYRATPTGKAISAGDYVTTSRLYAEEHIRANLGGKGKITSIQGTLDDLAPADAPNEFWYVPEVAPAAPEVVYEVVKPGNYQEAITPDALTGKMPTEMTRDELTKWWTFPGVNKLEPYTEEIPPVGTWRIDPELNELEQLRLFNVSELVSTEPEAGVRGREDYQKYLEWAKEGKIPPPIHVVRHIEGELRSTNRRRLMAANEAGVKQILGWFSETTPQGGVAWKYIEPPAIPKAEVGMPEAGLQPSMLEEVPAVEVRPEAKAELIQARMEDYLKLKKYEETQVANRIEEIKGLLGRKGRLPAGMGTKPEISLELARLEAQQDVAGFKSTEELEAAINEVENELGLRGMPYHGGVSQTLFPDKTSKQLDGMLNVYREARSGPAPEIAKKPLPPLPEPTTEQLATNLVTPGQPTLTPAQVTRTLDLFGKYITDPSAENAWELTRELRRETRAGRAENLKARAQELIVEKGVPVEDAMRQAIRETMSGELPVARTDYLSDLTDQMRDALFSKVYQTLKAEPFEMTSTVTALTNALLGKPIPREPGIRGGSAYTRLQRVFGGQPEVFEAIKTGSSEGKDLQGVIEGLYMEVGKPPLPIDKKMADWLRNLEESPYGVPTLFGKPSDLRVSDLRTPAELEYAKRKVELDVAFAKGEIDENRYKIDLSQAYDKAYPKPPVPPYEPPINDAIKEIPMWPRPARDMVIKVLKEIGWSPIDIGNFLRANKASFDFSFWRQQGPLILNHPASFVTANIKSWNATWSQKAAEASWESITHDPLYHLYDQIGVDFLRPLDIPKGTSQWRGVEEFGYLTGERLIPRLTMEIPWVKFSSRGFVTGTNEHNWRIFKNHYEAMLRLSEKYASGGLKLKPGEVFSIEKEMRDFATMLTDFTQRASLGKLQGLAPALNSMIFAPRATLGRFLTPRHLLSANPRVRAEAWRNLTTFIAGIGGIVLLGAQLGLWEVEKDPRSGEYMSIRVGNIRVDPWAGYRQFLVFYTRVITGTGLSSVTGAEYEIDPIRAMTTFIRGKASPLASIILDFWTGKNFIGEEVDVADKKQWVERIAPFSLQDIFEAYMLEPTKAPWVILPAIVGFGVQAYTGEWVENYPKLGLPKYTENLTYGLTEPVYDVKDFWADTAGQFKGVDPATLTENKGYPPYIRAIAETRIIKEHLDTLPNQSPISINADSEKGTTFIQYYQMWRDREKLVVEGDEEKLKAFDADERTRNAGMGNLTQRQFSLLVEYHSITDKVKQADFLEKHPELKVNPRQDWLISHPKDNAQLAVWGQANVLTQAAYDEARRLIKELDIPDSAIEEYLPPEHLAKISFAYEELASEGRHGSWEAQLLLKKDALEAGKAGVQSFADWRDLTLSDTPIASLELKTETKYRDIYNKIEDLKEDEKLSDEERAETIADLRNTKVDGEFTYRDIGMKIEALEKGTDEAPIADELVGLHVDYGRLLDQEGVGSSSAEVMLLRVDNPGYNAFRMDEDIWGDQALKEIDESRIPIWRRQVEHKESFDKLKAYGDEDSPLYLDSIPDKDNPDYEKGREYAIEQLRLTKVDGEIQFRDVERQIEALEKGTVENPVPDDFVKAHAAYGRLQDERGASSAEVMQFRYLKDKYNAWRMDKDVWGDNALKEIEVPKAIYDLLVKDRDLYDQEEKYKDELESISDPDDPDYKTGYQYAIAQLKEKNPEWVDNQRRIEAMGKGTIEEPTSDTMVEGWVDRGRNLDEFTAGSSEAKVWLIDHPDDFKWALDQELLTDDGTDWNIPVLRLNVAWRVEDDEYDALETDEAREDYLAGEGLADEALTRRVEYRKDRRRREVYRVAPADVVIDETMVEAWVGRGEVIDEKGAGSSEAKIFLIDTRDPKSPYYGLFDWALGQELLTDDGSDWNVPVLRINVAWREQDTEYEETIPGKYDDMSDKQMNAMRAPRGLDAESWGLKTAREKRNAITALDRENMLGDNPGYAVARWQKKGYELGLTTDLSIDKWVEYNQLPAYGDWRERYLLNDPDFFKEVTDRQKARGDDGWDVVKKARAKEYDTIYDRYKDLFDDYKDADDKGKKKIFAENPAFKENYYRREAYELYVPEKYVEDYTTYYLMPVAGYAQERYLKENRAFYKLIYDIKGWKEPIDFDKIPTKEVERLYNYYRDVLPPGNYRLNFRYEHPELDEWMLLTGKVTRPASEMVELTAADRRKLDMKRVREELERARRELEEALAD